MKTIVFFLFTLMLVSCAKEDHPSSKTVLYFDKPAGHFEESFVMGNGKAGASIFGGVTSEKIYLNDITLWSGEPVEVNMNPEAYLHLPEIREALENEDYALADKLNRNLQGKFSQSYAPMGTMHIHFDHADTVENYHRELNIGNAVSTLEYTVDDVKFSREYFVSYPDQVMVIHLTSDKKESLNFTIDFESLLRFNTGADGEIFEINGYAPYHVEPVTEVIYQTRYVLTKTGGHASQTSYA